MKKFFAFLIIFLLFFSFSRAFDCNIKIYEKNSFGKTLYRANIRKCPNISKTNILFVSKKNQKFKIIGKYKDWYKIKLENNNFGWIWKQVIQEEYILTKNDENLINLVSEKIEKLIKKNSLNSRKIFIDKLNSIKNSTKKIRLKILLTKIIENLAKNSKQNQKLEKQKIQKNFENKKNSEKKLQKDIINYDINKIRQTWINWHNIERKKLGLSPYIENNKLNISAKAWSVENRNAKKINHKRNPKDSYYDYKKITKWMYSHGVVCKNIYRATYSESIGRAWFSCNKSDCTDEIIKSIRGTFDYFMSEKGISGIAGAHYRAIVHKTFKQIGFDIAIEKIGKNNYRVYHTTHYCTQTQ